MEFRSPHPLEQCEQILYNHTSDFVIFSGTQVDINQTDANTSLFTVARVAKGKWRRLHKTSEITGTLRRVDAKQTDVSFNLEVTPGGYLAVGASIFVSAFALLSSYALLGLIALFLLAQIGYEVFAVRRIINSLRG